MNNEEMIDSYRDIKLITPEHLPPTSPLGRLYEKYLETPTETRTRDQANKLSREASELKVWLRRATLDTTTPEEFGLAKARLELLNQTIAEYEQEVKTLHSGSFNMKAKFEDEYTRYKLLVRALQIGDFGYRPGGAKSAYEQALRMVTAE